jgi:hypothetical protein
MLLSDDTTEYHHGPGGTAIEKVNLTSGAPTYFVSADQGSTRALITSAGSVVASPTYDTLCVNP